MKRRLRPESWKILAGVAVTAALLVPLLVLGGPAFAQSASSSSAQYQYQITICHFTHSAKHPAHTIMISSAAWPAHQRHGDHLGACTPADTAAKTVTHGHSSGSNHGKSGSAPGHSGGHGKP